MNFLKNISILSQACYNTLKLFAKNPMFTAINRSKFTAAETFGLRKLASLHIRGFNAKKKKPHPILMGSPFLKGVVLKTLIRKPKKPNSANRKCVLVRLSNGKEAIAYIPGIGHNLQEHQFVLVAAKKIRDLPGVKVRCVRGAYDLPHVIK